MDSDYCSKASTLLAALLTYMCFNVLTCPVAGRVQNGGLPGPGEVDTVCTAPFQPFSDCLLNDTIGAEPIGKVFVDPLELLQSAFCNLDKTSRPDCTIDKGYAAQVWKRTAQIVGISSSQYLWRCMDYDKMVADLRDPAGVCDVAQADVGHRDEEPNLSFFISFLGGGLYYQVGCPILDMENHTQCLCNPADCHWHPVWMRTIVRVTAGAASMFTLSRLNGGLRFGTPDYRSGQTILVHGQVQNSNQWIFFTPFTWQVWVMIFSTSIAVGFVIHIMEVVSKPHTDDNMSEMRLLGRNSFFDRVWAALETVVGLQTLSAISAPSRLVLLVWCFAVLLLLTMYTGNAAAILTAKSLQSSISSINDLRGQNWGTYDSVTKLVSQLGLVPAKVYPWNDNADAAVFIADLLADRVVVECAFIRAMVAMNCDLLQVGDCFIQTDRGQAFWANTTDATLFTMQQAVFSVKEAGELNRLQDAFIASTSNLCSSNALGSGIQPVKFGQVRGIWILLAITIGASTILTFVVRHVNEKKYVQTLMSQQKLRRLRSSFSMKHRASPVSIPTQDDKEVKACETYTNKAYEIEVV